MPGAMLIGDSAGLVNVPKIKGTHQAMRSGMLAAEHIAETGKSAGWDAKLRGSVVMKELRKVRNIRPGFNKGMVRTGQCRRGNCHRRPVTVDAEEPRRS